MDSRSKLSIKLDALQRLIMINTVSGVLPLYIVTEYPKSGGSWLAQMIAEYLDVPFPRNQRPNFIPSLMHGHMAYSPFMRNVICLHRDGRDIVVSLYYHSLFQNDKNSPHLVSRVRGALSFNDYNDIENNLPKFIEYIYERDTSSLSPFRFSWPEFVRSWMGKGSVHIKYEDLLNNGIMTLVSAIEKVQKKPVDKEKLKIIYEKYSFQNQTKRQPGEENRKSFLRKGISGDWQKKFNSKSARIFNEYAGKELIELGYEVDDSWVGRV